MRCHDVHNNVVPTAVYLLEIITFDVALIKIEKKLFAGDQFTPLASLGQS